MALSFLKRAYVGNGVAGTLASALPSTTTSGTFTSSTSLTGWVDQSSNNFSGCSLVLSFGYGTVNEEKILVTYNPTGSVFTLVTRGYDGTTPYSWPIGTTFIPVVSGVELAENNAGIQALKTLLTNAGTTSAPQPIAVSSTTAGSLGSAQVPAAIDHAHNISASTLNGWLTGSASGQMASGVTLLASQVTNLPASDNQYYAPSAITVGNTATTAAQLGAVVNPTGAFVKYAFTVNATVYGRPSSSSTDVHATVLYRTAGSSGSWTQASDFVIGVVTSSTISGARLSGNAVWSAPVSTTDYEFQLSFYCTNAAISGVTLSQFNLLVIGSN